MAGNPFVKIYRDALGCWLRLGLTGSQWAVLMYLASATWGWHRASTKKSLGEIAGEIGTSKRVVLRVVKSLEKAGLIIYEGEQRHRHEFRLRPPGEYTEIEANLVTKMTPVEAKPIESENLVTQMAKSGDINDTNLVTSSRSKLQSLNKPFNKDKRKKERNSTFEVSNPLNPPIFGGLSLKEDNPTWKEYLQGKDGRTVPFLKNSRLYQLEDAVILAFKYPLHKEYAEKSMESVQAIVADFIGDDTTVRCMLERELGGDTNA